jgi:hypothetical protein
MNWQEYISLNPQVMTGKPVIKGTRITVELILERLGTGWTTEQLLKSCFMLSILSKMKLFTTLLPDAYIGR